MNATLYSTGSSFLNNGNAEMPPNSLRGNGTLHLEATGAAISASPKVTASSRKKKMRYLPNQTSRNQFSPNSSSGVAQIINQVAALPEMQTTYNPKDSGF
jgi:hypothetical protein